MTTMASLSENSKGAQQKYMGPLAPPIDQIDKPPGRFGPIGEDQRATSLKGVGVVAFVMAAILLLKSVSDILGWGL